MKKTYVLALIFIVLISVAIILLVSSNPATTKNECEFGGGTWTTPQISQGNDPDSSAKELQSYCSCEIGSYWNDTFKKCSDDSQLRCIQTQGEWINNSCQCPEGTIKWTVGFGCDTRGPVPLSNENFNETKNKEVSYIWLLVILVILILVTGLIIKNRKKQNENK